MRGEEERHHGKKPCAKNMLNTPFLPIDQLSSVKKRGPQYQTWYIVDLFRLVLSAVYQKFEMSWYLDPS